MAFFSIVASAFDRDTSSASYAASVVSPLLCALAYVSLRVGLAAVVRTLVRTAGAVISTLLPQKVAIGAAAAVAGLFAFVGRELSAVGTSATNIADDIETRRLSMLADLESDGEEGDAPPAAATA